MFEYSEKLILAYITGIYDGSITEYDLPESLYGAIGRYFEKGLYKGFGMDLKEAAGKDLELLAELRENTWLFSSAKTFQQTKDIGSMMFNDKGDLIGAKEFNELGTAAFDKWNSSWGLTEYNTAVGQAQNAVKWNEIEKQKKVLPMLRYSAIEDANTSEECALMDNVVAPVDDPIWDANAPMQHFNCRCVLIQEEEGDSTITSDDSKEEIVSKVDEFKNPLFNMNAGKDGYVFKDDHPYFQVEKKDREFAKENFGLPMPEAVKGIERAFVPAESIKEAEERINNFNISVNAKSMKLEHLNKTLEAIETVPVKARPTSIYDKAGYEQNFGRKINRKASEFQGMAQTAEVFDKKAMEFRQEKVLVINSREFKLPSDITEKKIKFNEWYVSKTEGNKWYLNTFDGSTHYHEMGHLYDSNISTKKEWIDISNKWHNETKADMIKVSKGGDFRGENGSEAFAEAFASYFGNNKKGLPEYIVEYFDKNIK